MQEDNITFIQWFSSARRVYKANRGKIFLFMGIWIIWSFTIILDKYLSFSYITSNSITLIIGTPLWAGFYFWCLKLVRGEKATTMDFLSGFRYFLQVCISGLLLDMIVLAGVILLIIPGVIWFLKFVFAPVIAIDKKAGPLESLRISARITQGRKNELISVLFCFIAAVAMQFPFLNGLGNLGIWWAPWFIILGLPLYLLSVLVVYPFTACLWMAAYDSFVKQQDSAPCTGSGVAVQGLEISLKS